ncbi:hypothetical protein [Streptomyces lydicus]|uniref:hypothetical protein n=1 Tax=Streptomyces lydicus TaxID=47763 RepID=UPI0038242491
MEVAGHGGMPAAEVGGQPPLPWPRGRPRGVIGGRLGRIRAARARRRPVPRQITAPVHPDQPPGPPRLGHHHHFRAAPVCPQLLAVHAQFEYLGDVQHGIRPRPLADAVQHAPAERRQQSRRPAQQHVPGGFNVRHRHGSSLPCVTSRKFTSQ